MRSIQKWTFLHPTESSAVQLQTLGALGLPQTLSVGLNSKTVETEIKMEVPTGTVAFVECYKLDSARPYRLIFVCVGNDLPFPLESSLYDNVREVHFKGDILSWNMVFKVIAGLKNCDSVVFEWREREALGGFYGGGNDRVSFVEGQVSRVKHLCLLFPHDHEVAQDALRGHLEIVTTVFHRRYPKIQTLTLNLPDAGWILDMMKEFVGKFADLRNRKIGIRNGRTIVEKIGDRSFNAKEHDAALATSKAMSTPVVAGVVRPSTPLPITERDRQMNPSGLRNLRRKAPEILPVAPGTKNKALTTNLIESTTVSPVVNRSPAPSSSAVQPPIINWAPPQSNPPVVLKVPNVTPHAVDPGRSTNINMKEPLPKTNCNPIPKSNVACPTLKDREEGEVIEDQRPKHTGFQNKIRVEGGDRDLHQGRTQLSSVKKGSQIKRAVNFNSSNFPPARNNAMNYSYPPPYHDHRYNGACRGIRGRGRPHPYQVWHTQHFRGRGQGQWRGR